MAETHLDLQQEVKRYRAEFAKLGDEFADVDFVVDELVSTAQQVVALKDRLLGPMVSWRFI